MYALVRVSSSPIMCHITTYYKKNSLVLFPMSNFLRGNKCLPDFSCTSYSKHHPLYCNHLGGKMGRLITMCDIVNVMFFFPGKKKNLVPKNVLFIFYIVIDFRQDAVVVKWLVGMWDWQQGVFLTFSPGGNAFLSQQAKNLPTSQNNNHPRRHPADSCKEKCACVCCFFSTRQCLAQTHFSTKH